jgi:CSLREA domain-containing protein
MQRIFILLLAALLAQCTVGLLAPSRPAGAAPAEAVFSVNTTLDQPDASPHDGACLSTPSGLCTLRAAIQQANAAAGDDTILLQPGQIYHLTLSGQDDAGAVGDLDILDSLTLAVQGAGRATIDGNGAVTGDRVFQIDGAADVVSMTGLVIENGEAVGPGGGIYNNASSLALYQVTVRNNRADSLGGGIFNASRLSLSSSTVSDNHATADGGGLHQVAITATLSLVNSTVSGNNADGFGGGLYVVSGTVNLASTTFAYNRADFDSSGNGAGGGLYRLNGQVILKNSLLAHNRRGLIFSSVPDDCSGTLNSGDYNLIQTVAGCAFTGPTTHHLTGADPLLGILQDNGGPTETHALQEGSPAVDAANPAGCRAWGALPLLLSADQRGLGRADGDDDGTDVCDIGAFEHQPTPGGASTLALYLPFVTR